MAAMLWVFVIFPPFLKAVKFAFSLASLINPIILISAQHSTQTESGKPVIVGSVVQDLVSAPRCAISLHLSQDAGTGDSAVQGGVVRLTFLARL